jgi:hypothetical protein
MKLAIHRSILVVLLCFFVAGRSASQNKELDELGRTSYVERFTHYFFIWPEVKQKSTSFSIQDQATGRKITFKPNVPLHVGAGFYMFGVGAQVLVALPASGSSESMFGLSSAFDLQANILGKNWGIDIFTQNYKGYYSTDNDKPTQSGAASPQRKDISTWNTGVNGIYYFNRRRYSMRSTYNYYERQLKSAGSFLLSGDINTFALRADSAIYSPSYVAYFGSDANFQRLDYTTFSIAPGYAYNFVVRKTYFVGASVAYGPAINWIHFNNGINPWNNQVNFNTYLDVRLAAGYNSERFFTGVVYSHQARNMIYDGVLLSSTNDMVKFSVGYRFVEKGILKRRAYDIFKPKVAW